MSLDLEDRMLCKLGLTAGRLKNRDLIESHSGGENAKERCSDEGRQHPRLGKSPSAASRLSERCCARISVRLDGLPAPVHVRGTRRRFRIDPIILRTA